MKRLVESYSWLKPGRVRSFLLVVLYLLLTAGLVFVIMTVAACDCDCESWNEDCDDDDPPAAAISKSNTKGTEPKPKTNAKITNPAGGSVQVAGPDQQAQRLLNLTVTEGSPPTSVAYTWVPPVGASNFGFSGRQPEPGGPPFVFLDVPPDEEIPVTFDLPGEGPYKGNLLPESLTARPDVGEATTAYYLTTLTSQAASQPLAPEPAPTELARARPEATVEMWTIDRWFARDIAVSSEECQRYLDLLQSDAPFLAIQLPEPPHAVTESALLPIYYSATLNLVDYSGDLDVAGEATFRPERFSFVANELPAKPGTIWTALGLSSTSPLTCPTGLETDNWEIYTQLTLDLSYVPDNCTGCVLDRYLCYESQELPGNSLQRYAARQLINRSLEDLTYGEDGMVGVHNYQDWGITCAGPLPLQLVHAAWDDWELTGASAQWVTPTMPITLPQKIMYQVPDPPQLIDLEYSTTLDADWRWSDGTQTFSPPFSYAGGGWPGRNIHLVGTVPAGTPDGLHTVYITATLVSTPTDYRLSSHAIWVGDWVPPGTGTTTHSVYLPLVRKQRP